MDVITQIQEIQAREIIDSRGNPTVEAEVTLADGTRGRPRSPAALPPANTKPSSCATATRALPRQRRAEGRRKCERRNRRSPRRHGRRDQRAIDQKMIDLDGTENKGRLGANAILAVSMAAARAAAATLRPAALSLPRRRRRKHSAHADDEHPQRRRARRQQRGLPGIHGHAGRRAESFPKRCAGASKSSTR